MDEALRVLLQEEAPLGAPALLARLRAAAGIRPVTEVAVDQVSLASFDDLLENPEVVQ